jgi:hypothetical protein
VAVAVLLVVGPLAFNLAREPGFKASVQLFPSAVAPYPKISDPRYYEALLADPELREQMRLNVGDRVAKYEDVTIRRGPGSDRLTVTAEADKPEKAQRFVNGLAPQIAGATRRQLGLVVQQDVDRLRVRLGRGASGAAERSIRRRLRRLVGYGEFPPPRVLPGANAPRPRIERWADRLVDDLPGDFRARPDPAWAALAGLLVAATLWAIGLVLAPPGRRRG